MELTPLIGQNPDGTWFFYDETWDTNGPHASKEEAEKALDAYCHWLETGEDPIGGM